MKTLVLLVVITYGLFAKGEDTSSTLIKGFSKWQADRVERIVIDEAINSIFENNTIRSFYPYTSIGIIDYDGISKERLIPILQYYIKKDMDITKRVAEKCLPNLLVDAIIKTIQEDDKSLNHLDLFFQKINKVVRNKDGKQTISSFLENENCKDDSKYLEIKGIKDKLILALIIKIKEKGKIKKLLNINEDKIEEIIEAIKNKNTTKIKEEFSKLEINKTKFIQNLEEKEDKSKKVYSLLMSYQDLNNIFNEDANNSKLIKTHKALTMVKEFLSDDDETYYTKESFNKLKNISLFLSEIVDALESEGESRDKVESIAAILERYLDDDDAYIKKRNDNAFISRQNSYNDKRTITTYWNFYPDDVLFLSSYYGLSYTSDKVNLGNNNTRLRAHGPIGLEVKVLATRNWAYLFNYSFFDIGAYITKELEDNESDPKVKDIFEKSVFISFSSRKKPLSILIGRNIDEKYSFISVSFDLPIFTIR